jgi:hypothetical protein
MEKLIELLNEYENTDNWENWHQVEFRESKIISKKFWFIKWLVENDKIDRRQFEDFDEYSYVRMWHWWMWWVVIRGNDKNSDFLISVLSISEQPIEDLISYLR